MESFTIVLFAVMVLVATSCAAPNNKPYDLKIPDECQARGFCSIKPKGYDKIAEKINSLLPSYLINNNIGDRISDASELSPESDWDNCPYIKSTNSHYLFKHNDTKADYIIQTALHNQPIESIRCANEKIDTNSNIQCFKNLGFDPFGKNTRCVTSTSRRKLLVFDPDTETIKQEEFDVDCCCSCSITNVV